MKATFTSVFGLLIFVTAFQTISGKEWRGIVPMHSTRTDVVRLFSQCFDANESCNFSVGNEDVYIVFSGGAMSEFHECARKLPTDTVLLVEVKLKTPVKFDELRLGKKRFKTFDPSSPPNIGYKGYINQSEGLIIKTYKGEVLQFDYIAVGRDASRCASYYESPKSFIQLLIEGCCPPLAVLCPQGSQRAGERVMISAESSADLEPTFHWSLTAGRIVEGQGTRMITVDTTGLGGRIITTTVEMHLGKEGVSTAASCVVQIANVPKD